MHIVTSGALVPEAIEAAHVLLAEGIPANVLNLTSPRRLFESWQNIPRDNGPQLNEPTNDPFGWLIPLTERYAPIVTVMDGSAHALSWLGSVFGTPVIPLGVNRFGQSGSRPDLYRHYGIDADAIVNAALEAINRVGLS